MRWLPIALQKAASSTGGFSRYLGRVCPLGGVPDGGFELGVPIPLDGIVVRLGGAVVVVAPEIPPIPFVPVLAPPPAGAMFSPIALPLTTSSTRRLS